MKLYRVSYHPDPDDSDATHLEWATSRRGAEKLGVSVRKIYRLRVDEVSIEPVDVPTTRDALCTWLNMNCSGDA